MISSSTFAQDGTYVTVRDMESWSRASLEYKPTKKWRFKLSQEFRLRDNSSNVRKYFTQLKTDYKIAKRVSLGVAGRFIRINDNKGNVQGYENHLRIALYTQYAHKVERLRLKYRLQYQNRNELGITKDEGDNPINKMRFRIASSYNIKNWKLDPRLSTEIFRTLGENGQFSKYRFTMGTKYSTKQYGDFGLFYRIQREINITYPVTTHILGLQYNYTLKRNNKDEKSS